MDKQILDEGFGIIPHLVMEDKDLSVEAKTIYSYMCSNADSDRKASMTVNTIVDDLNISSQRFFRHRKELVNRGYITIEKRRIRNRAGSNIYILNDFKGGN